MRLSLLITAMALFIASAAAAQHEGHGMPVMTPGMRTPTVAASPDGRLWRAWVDGSRVLVAASSDLGRTWGASARVNRTPESIDANSESRPKIVLGSRGEIYVTYTRNGKRPYTGDIRFSRSLDGGRTFSDPITVNDDGLETGHRFDALDVARDGTVFVIWIDKRDLEGALASQKAYSGAALYYTTSSDRGATFAKNRKIKDFICECCRIAHAFDAQGRLVLFWRDVMDDNIRDHALVRLTANGPAAPVQRVTADGWTIDACPHHGPDLSIDANGSLHIVWFTGEGKLGPGAFYGRLTPDAKLQGTPLRLGPAEPTTGHAVVYATDRQVLVAWKERRAPEGAAVMLIVSGDGGATFSAPRELASTRGVSDYPFLIGVLDRVLLSWFSPSEGHRVVTVQ